LESRLGIVCIVPMVGRAKNSDLIYTK